MRWTEKDKKGVRAILDHVTANSGQAELGRALGDLKRSTVNIWRRRGRIPVEHHAALIELAAKTGLTISADQLHPDARTVLAIPPRNAA